ncbi:MAG TPA: hemerythrin domain-containing protein [Kutzneria sp.]|jgi:hemerythrin-like domain-containing protein
MTEEALADVRDMYMVHTMLRRELRALPGLIAAPGMTQARAKALVEHVRLVLAVLESHHHAEDVHLWPRLAERVGADTVAEVESQHTAIERTADAAATALAAWVEQPGPVASSTLSTLLEALCVIVDEHMDTEERTILPLARKQVTASEWHAMAGASGAGLPPGSRSLVFGMTAYEADPEVMADTLAALPPEVRSKLEADGAREFAAHSRLIHGTETPAKIGHRD